MAASNVSTDPRLQTTTSAPPPPSTTDDPSSSFLVRYRNGLYDLRRFVHKHPGGRNTLDGLAGRDIDARMRAAPPHSAAAMYLLREYRVADSGGDAIGHSPTDANNNRPEPADASAGTDVKLAGDEWHAHTDDSMEVIDQH